MSGRELSPEHRHLLEVESGISREVIASQGFWTATKSSELRLCGFSAGQSELVPALVLPQYDVDGHHWGDQIRPNQPRLDDKGKPRKYENKAGSVLRLDVPRLLQSGLSDAKTPLLITEGTRKICSFLSWRLRHGLPYCGLALLGVNAFRTSDEMRRDWSQIALKNRTVYVAFDSDVMTKPQVRRALVKLGHWLSSEGAKVLYVRLPGDESAKTGLDDYLVQTEMRLEPLQELLDAASPRVPGFDPKCKFRMEGGKTFEIVLDKEDNEVLKPIADFEAVITSEIRSYDAGDGPASIAFRIEGANGLFEFPTVEVPASEFEAMGWVSKLWGARAVIQPGKSAKEQLRYAIQVASQGGIELVDCYRSIGWRKIRGQWVYLHSGGGIGKDGPVDGFNVRLEPKLKRYLLPAPAGEERLRDALKGSLSFLELQEHLVGYPLYMSLWRSVLGPSNFALHLYGPTGTFKTNTVLHLLKHFGPWTEHRDLVGAGSSAAGLEFAANAVGDALLLVDDYKPTLSERQKEAFGSFLQSIGDGSGRTRGNAAMKVRESLPPRGTVITTGEEAVPGGESTLARTLSIRVRELDEDEKGERLRKLKDWPNGEEAATAMASYLAYLARNLEGKKEEWSGKVREWDKRLGRIAEGLHARTVGAACELLAAFELFLSFCKDAKALSDAEVEQHRNAAFEAMSGVVLAQGHERKQEDPVAEVLSLTNALLSAQHAHLCDAGDGESCPGENFGWQRIADDKQRAIGPKIGWYSKDRRRLFLEAESWMVSVKEFARRSGRPVSIQSRELFHRLVETGIADRGTEKKRGEWLVKRSVGADRRRVIDLPVSAIGRDDEPCPILEQEVSRFSAGSDALAGRGFEDVQGEIEPDVSVEII